MMTNFTWLGFLQILYISVNGEGIGVPVVGRASSQPKSKAFYTEPLYPISYMYYEGKIRVGTPKEGEPVQEFTMLFDSGSTDLVILDSNAKRSCTIESKKANCESVRPNKFDTSKSSTYVRTDGTFAVSFLDKSGFSGHVARDFIELGEGESKLRVIATMGLTDHVANEACSTDGVFGVGLRSDTTFKPSMDTLTAIECIFTQTNIPPQIGYYIERNEEQNSNGHYHGEIYFGGYNSQYVDSDFMDPVPIIHYLLSDFSWSLDLKSIKVGRNLIDVAGQDLDGDTIPGTMAVPDTGNTFTSITENIFDLILTYVFGKEHRKFSSKESRYLCDELPDNLPEVEFIFNNDVTLKFGPEIYIRSRADALVCEVLWSPTSDKRVVFGNDMLQKYYTVFDYKKKEVKFALAKQNEFSKARQQPGKYGKIRVNKLSKEVVNTIRKNWREGLDFYVPVVANDIAEHFRE